MSNKIRIAVGLEGGVVQWVIADKGADIELTVVDFDVEGETDFRLEMVRDTNGAEGPAAVARQSIEVVGGKYFDDLARSPVINGFEEYQSQHKREGAYHVLSKIHTLGPHGEEHSFEHWFEAESSVEACGKAMTEIEWVMNGEEFKSFGQTAQKVGKLGKVTVNA